MSQPGLSPQYRISQLAGTLLRLLSDNAPEWFNLSVEITQFPSLSPSLSTVSEQFIPDADICVATAWQTAYFVASLSKSKGEKAYFVQHYEIWDMWNSEECWKMVSERFDDSSAYPILMSKVDPPSREMEHQKKLVDNSYQLPLSIITISSWLNRLLKTQFDREPIATINNSVNHDVFYYDSTDNYDARLSVLVPYRSAAWKGKKQASELLTRLSEHDDTIDLHAFAPSGNSDELPNSVTWHEGISDSELRRLYSDTDILVVPSWVEGYHLPPLEAMACKTAIVATEVGCIPDLMKKGDVVVPVPPRDSEALIREVQRLIRNPQRIETLKNNGYKLVNSYSWDDFAEQFEEALVTIKRDTSTLDNC